MGKSCLKHQIALFLHFFINVVNQKLKLKIKCKKTLPTIFYCTAESIKMVSKYCYDLKNNYSRNEENIIFFCTARVFIMVSYTQL